MSQPPDNPFPDPPRGSSRDSSPGPTRPGGSVALQGCLFGSVALFVVMLLVMIFLAYGRFRENTAEPVPAAPSTPALMIDG